MKWKPTKKVMGRTQPPLQILRNQICVTGGLLGRALRAVPVQADSAGREWVQLKASAPWLVAATTGKGSIRQSSLKFVTLMSDVHAQLLAAEPPEEAPQANALAPAGVGRDGDADDPLAAMLRKRGLGDYLPAGPARASKPPPKKSKLMAGMVTLGPGAHALEIEARAPRALSLRGRGGVDAAATCEIMLSDLPWAIEYMQREVGWQGVPQTASDAGAAGVAATSQPIAPAPGGACEPELRYDQVSCTWSCEVGGRRLFVEVPVGTQRCKRTPVSPETFLANKERARRQLWEAARAEAAGAETQAAPAAPSPCARGGSLGGDVVELSD